jgi:hypothetical protein
MTTIRIRSQRYANRTPETIPQEEQDEALSPTTTQRRLQQIFFVDASLDFCLVKNPNIPFDLLFLLAETLPTEVLANPSFGLHLLENPSAIDDVIERYSGTTLSMGDVLCGLVSIRPLPEWLVDVLWASTEARQFFGYSSEPPMFWIERSLDAGENLSQIARKLNLTEEQMKRLALCPEETVRTRLASNGKLTPSVIELLRNDPSEHVRRAIASHSPFVLPPP